MNRAEARESTVSNERAAFCESTEREERKLSSNERARGMTHTPGPRQGMENLLTRQERQNAKILSDLDKMRAQRDELLAALKELVRASDGHSGSIQARQAARTIIAKAEGK